jgi:hypothetical protein
VDDGAGEAIGEVPVEVADTDVGLELVAVDVAVSGSVVAVVGVVDASADDDAGVVLGGSEAGTETVADADGASPPGLGTELGVTVAFGSWVTTLAFNWFTWSIRFCLRVVSFTVCTVSLTAASLSWA